MEKMSDSVFSLERYNGFRRQIHYVCGTAGSYGETGEIAAPLAGLY